MAKARGNASIPDDVFAEILADVAAGEPTYRACESRGVNRRKFYAALSDEALANRYARAKGDGLDALAEEIVALADECRMGVKTTTKADGSVETVSGDMVDRTRLQIDSRKWLLSKLAPKKYGDKLDVNANVGVTVTLPSPLVGV